MFRHTTKQRALDQLTLRTRAFRQAESTSDEKTEDVFATTYGLELPQSTISMLQPIVRGLSGPTAAVSKISRNLHTAGMWVSSSGSVMRLIYLQPDIVTCTATVPAQYYGKLVESLPDVVEACNGCKPCRVVQHTRVCQIVGRMTPYLVEWCGMSDSAAWGHINAMGSKFLMSCTNTSSTSYYQFTKASLELLQPYAAPECAFVQLESAKSFKLTAAPIGSTATDMPNKNTCMMVQCDGSFKIQGLPSAAGVVCRGFRRCIERLSTAVTWELFLSSMESIKAESSDVG